MNKTLINTLSTAIVIILGAYVLLPCIMMALKFADTNTDVANQHEGTTPVEVAFTPEVAQLESIEQTVSMSDGNDYSMLVQTGYLMVPSDKVNSPIANWVGIISIGFTFIIFVVMVVYLIKFVISINKGQIFVKKNVRRLNTISFCLIGISLLYICSGIANEFVVSNLNFSLQGGSSINANWEIPWSNLLMGLLSLLIAQAWNRGIELREDHELTI